MKKTILTSDELQEFDFLLNWDAVVMDFWERIAPSPSGKSWRDDIPPLKKNKEWLQGLREAYNDTLEEVYNLNAEQYRELDQILRTKFGQGLIEADQKHVNRILKIVAKNKITTEEQYYLLREYFERIWDMPEHKETANKIETMLFDFDEKEAKKQAKTKKESVVAESEADYLKSIKQDDLNKLIIKNNQE